MAYTHSTDSHICSFLVDWLVDRPNLMETAGSILFHVKEVINVAVFIKTDDQKKWSVNSSLYIII